MRVDQRRALMRIHADLDKLKSTVSGDLANALGVLSNDLQWVLNQENINLRLPPQSVQEVLDLYVKGVPFKQMEVETQLSSDAIRRYVKRAQLPKRHNYPSRGSGGTK